MHAVVLWILLQAPVDEMRSLLASGDVARATSSVRAADVLTRRAAVWVLARAAPQRPAEVRAPLLDAALDADSAVREWAARGLCQLPPSPEVVQRTAFLLDDEDRTVRLRAVRCVESYGPAAAALVPRAAEQFRIGESELALAALLAVGPAAAPSVREWVRLGSDSAARACRVLDAGDVQDVTPGLQAAEHYKRVAAVRCLGEMGRAASSAVPALEALLSDRHVSRAAHDALTRIRGTP